MSRQMFQVGMLLVVMAFGMSAVGCAETIGNEKKLIGTWTDQDGKKWEFKTDGTYVIDGATYKFGATNSQIFLGNGVRDGDVANYTVSADGKTIIISYTNYYKGGYLLKKAG